MEQLLLHALGDYIIQNDWMALNKKKKGWLGTKACLIHCLFYSIPFLYIANWRQVLLIFIAHYLIDRWHFVDYFLAFRNNVDNIENFGFSAERPFTITIWLYIITDNIFHLIINYLIL